MNFNDIKQGDFIEITSTDKETWLIYVINVLKHRYAEVYTLYNNSKTIRYSDSFPIFEDDTISYMSKEEKQNFMREFKKYRMNKQ